MGSDEEKINARLRKAEKSEGKKKVRRMPENDLLLIRSREKEEWDTNNREKEKAKKW